MEPDEITECLEQLGRQAKKAAAAAPAAPMAFSPAAHMHMHSHHHGVGSPLSGVEGLYLPHYLNPPRPAASAEGGKQQQAATPATPCPGGGGEGKLTRALSPTGVDELDAMLLDDNKGMASAAAAAAEQECEEMMRGVVSA